MEETAGVADRAVVRPDYQALILATGGLLSPAECVALAEAAATATGPALEVGNYTGLSTLVLNHALPASAPLITVDTHEWRDTARAFLDHVRRYGHQALRSVQQPYQAFLQDYTGPPFHFVFYDGPHCPTECETFWRLLTPHLAPEAQVLVDDADWASMAQLGERLAQAGFVDRTGRPLVRHAIAYTTGDPQVDLDLGKRHPDTFTLARWTRP